MTVAAAFAGIADRTAAETLKGVELYVERARLPEPDEDEWYYADLIGLAAISPEGETLGEVIAVQNFGAGDLLEIRPAAGGRTLLVPFVKAAVPVVDMKARRVVVNMPEDEDEQP
jgi:16S rRNA processing protein RimM